jgi:uncharacterized protein YecE (DUF72 family)
MLGDSQTSGTHPAGRRDRSGRSQACPAFNLETVVYVGTSGWQYKDWRGSFYPEKVAQQEWLEWYCRHFRTVELNNSFYNLPEASVFARWRERTPEGFVVAVKMSRFLTHIKKLNDPAEPVHRFLERASELGSRLGPVLVQLPPRFKAVPERLDETLSLFPSRVRVAVEFRDPSWLVDEVKAVLEKHGAAFVLADSPRRKQPDWRTADWGFVRFHEGTGTPRPCYEETALRGWAEKVAALFKPGEDVYAYFNNDHHACAVRDAGDFARVCREAGLDPTPVTAPVTVGGYSPR